jgi:hypothetical protein
MVALEVSPLPPTPSPVCGIRGSVHSYSLSPAYSASGDASAQSLVSPSPAPGERDVGAADIRAAQRLGSEGLPLLLTSGASS